MSDVTIYGLPLSTFTRSIAIVCEEKNTDYEISLEIAGKQVELGSPEQKALHPFGKFPVVMHQGNLLCETLPVCRYLNVALAGTDLYSANAFRAAQIDQWGQLVTIYVDKAIMRDYLLEIVFPKGENGAIRYDKIEEAKPMAIAALAAVEKQLRENQYIAAEQFTIADVLLAPIVHYITTISQEFALVSDNSIIREYLDRLLSRPSCQKVLRPLSG